MLSDVCLPNITVLVPTLGASNLKHIPTETTSDSWSSKAIFTPSPKLSPEIYLIVPRKNNNHNKFSRILVTQQKLSPVENFPLVFLTRVVLITHAGREHHGQTTKPISKVRSYSLKKTAGHWPNVHMTDQINSIPHINLQPMITLNYMHFSNTQTMIENFLHADVNCT